MGPPALLTTRGRAHLGTGCHSDSAGAPLHTRCWQARLSDAGSRLACGLDRMEPLPRRLRRPIVGREWSAPTHLSWVAGVGPVEPHTEVADHERVYDGNCRAGRSRPLDSAGRAARGRAVGGADAAFRCGAA